MLSFSRIVAIFVFICIGRRSLSLNYLRARGQLTGVRRFDSRCQTDFSSITALHSTMDTADSEVIPIKLPIIQIFKTNAITGEFVCGNEMSASIDKFQSTLRSLKESVETSASSGNYGVSNVYSEDQLTNILTSTQDYVVLKLFRVGCKKCEKLEPIFDELSRDPVYSRFQFLQADVAYVETYKKNLKERLMGLRGGRINARQLSAPSADEYLTLGLREYVSTEAWKSMYISTDFTSLCTATACGFTYVHINFVSEMSCASSYQIKTTSIMWSHSGIQFCRHDEFMIFDEKFPKLSNILPHYLSFWIHNWRFFLFAAQKNLYESSTCWCDLNVWPVSYFKKSWHLCILYFIQIFSYRFYFFRLLVLALEWVWYSKKSSFVSYRWTHNNWKKKEDVKTTRKALFVNRYSFRIGWRKGSKELNAVVWLLIIRNPIMF